jgi:hypothetical protein
MHDDQNTVLTVAASSVSLGRGMGPAALAVGRVRAVQVCESSSKNATPNPNSRRFASRN